MLINLFLSVSMGSLLFSVYCCSRFLVCCFSFNAPHSKMTFRVIRLEGGEETKLDHQGLLVIVNPTVLLVQKDRLIWEESIRLSPGASRDGD